MLGCGENINNGLTAKNCYSCISVAEHVAYGSNGGTSKYISTCSSTSGVQTIRRLKLRSRRYRYGTTQIVEIDVNELPENVKLIDLTTRDLRKQYELGSFIIDSKFHKHAEEFGEVLLEGSVPSNCLKAISL